MWTGEHISGCLTVKLTAIGGISVLLAPVCSVDLGVIPDNVLMTSDGRPIVTSDGYYIVVNDGGFSTLYVGNGEVLLTANDEHILVND